MVGPTSPLLAKAVHKGGRLRALGGSDGLKSVGMRVASFSGGLDRRS